MILCALLSLLTTTTTAKGKHIDRTAGVTDAYYYGTNRSIDVFRARLHARINSEIQRSASYREMYSSSWIAADTAATTTGAITDNNSRQQQQQSLLFIKSHKTGGSTLSRLLFRVLCESASTTYRHCFIPPYDSPGKIWDLRKKVDERYVKVTGNKKDRPYDVWVHHTSTPGIIHNEVMAIGTFSLNMTMLPVHNVMNVTTLRGDRFTMAMPMVVSICRRPALRFRSAWEWYGHQTTLEGLALTDFISLFMCDDRGSSTARLPDHCHTPSSVHPDQQQPQLHQRVSNRSHVLTDRAVQYAEQLRYRTGLDATSTELIGLDAFDHLHTGGQGRLRGTSMMPAGTPHLQSPSSTTSLSSSNNHRMSSSAIIQLFVDKVVSPMLQCQSLVMVSDRFDESLLVLRMVTRATVQPLHLLDLAYVRQKVTPVCPLAP